MAKAVEPVMADSPVKEMRLQEALRETLRYEMARDKRLFVMGEDVALFGGDPGTAYRAREEIEQWKQRCPIKRLKEKLINEKSLSEGEFEKLSASVYAELEEVAAKAEAAPLPPKEVELDGVFAKPEAAHG